MAILTVFTVNAQKVNYPFGSAQGFTVAPTSTLAAVTATNQMIYMSAVPTLTANVTLSVTVSSSLKAGAILMVAIKTTSTEVVTYGGALKSLNDTGAVGKTFGKAFIYNGTYFYPMGAKQRID